MSTAAKVMGRVIIKRTQNGVDDQLRPEQAGYRKGRSTTERISVLCNIIEQVIEWNSFPYLCFVDFEKVFDGIHGDSIWHSVLDGTQINWNGLMFYHRSNKAALCQPFYFALSSTGL